MGIVLLGQQWYCTRMAQQPKFPGDLGCLVISTSLPLFFTLALDLRQTVDWVILTILLSPMLACVTLRSAAWLYRRLKRRRTTM